VLTPEQGNKKNQSPVVFEKKKKKIPQEAALSKIEESGSLLGQ
jgi:hypothetical protein